MRRLALGIGGFLIVWRSASAQVCDSFPVSGSSTGASSAVVSVCGHYTGCTPHAPTYQLIGDQINVTLVGAEAPDCQCIAVESHFQQSLLVSPIAPGTYSVHADLLDCVARIPSGGGTLVVAARPRYRPSTRGVRSR